MPPHHTSSRRPTSGHPAHTYVVTTRGRHRGRHRDPVRGHRHHHQVHHSRQTVRLPNDIMPLRERILLTCFRITTLNIYTVSKRELVHGPPLLPAALRPVDALRIPGSLPDRHHLRDISPPPSISPTPYVLFPLNDPFHPSRDVWEPFPIQF